MAARVAVIVFMLATIASPSPATGQSSPPQEAPLEASQEALRERKVSILVGVGNAMGWLGVQGERYVGTGRWSLFGGVGYVPPSESADTSRSGGRSGGSKVCGWAQPPSVPGGIGVGGRNGDAEVGSNGGSQLEGVRSPSTSGLPVREAGWPYGSGVNWRGARYRRRIRIDSASTAARAWAWIYLATVKPNGLTGALTMRRRRVRWRRAA